MTETTSNSSSGLHTNAFNTTITSHTFEDGKGVITFNDDVTSIGDSAFRFCSRLTSITIPDSVTSIGDYAFDYCSGLTSITCKRATPPTLGISALPSNVDYIYVPSGSVNAYKTKTNWKLFASKITTIE